jgi:hypothetical protein
MLWMYKIDPAACFESTDYLMDVACTTYQLYACAQGSEYLINDEALWNSVSTKSATICVSRRRIVLSFLHSVAFPYGR